MRVDAAGGELSNPGGVLAAGELLNAETEVLKAGDDNPSSPGCLRGKGVRADDGSADICCRSDAKSAAEGFGC